jgi:integrase
VSAVPADDPRVLPTTLTGQLVLVLLPRELTDEHQRRIRDRPLRGQETTKAAAAALVAERGLSKAMASWLARTIRLALAVRDADGHELVPADALDDLPQFSDWVAEVLGRAGMLGPRRVPRPVPVHDPSSPRGCVDCDCWGIHIHPRCTACQQWKFGLKHPLGDCRRCGRSGSPIRGGFCRACSVHLNEHGPDAAEQGDTQLWLGGEFALKLQRRNGHLGYDVYRHRAQRRAASRRPAPPLSPHLVDPAQGVLVDLRRDWSCIAIGSLDRLPSLPPNAAQLLEQFRSYAQRRHWDAPIRHHALRSLRIVLAWVGTDAPVPEVDIRALATDRPGSTARRVVEFLADRDLLIPDPARQLDPDERVTNQHLRTLPVPIADEVRHWVQVLRGEGRRPHPARSFETIRKYLGYIAPVLHDWAGKHQSLREITPAEIHDALHGLVGSPANDRLTALRSMFRALKQERLIFRDPTRGITGTDTVTLPTPVPTDRLRGLIERADGAMAQLMVALVAIHALGSRELTRLRLAELDLARGTLTVHRVNGQRLVYLDKLTHRLATAWLQERRRRWPVTTNPHLLVSRQTAEMNTGQAISTMLISNVFRPLGLTPSALRQDRILDEACRTADPVHLMRVFDIGVKTAVHYVYTAHPERRATSPR